jgi:Baseplate J-like protein
MSTNVPSITWSNGSPVLPAETDILAGVQADINSAFGGGVNPSLQTPQGQIAQSNTAIIGEKNNEIAYIANQVNPSMASGIWQDAIGEIYFITRIPGAGTVVNATCIGAVGTVIPVGAVAQDTSGYLYSATETVTIPASGSAIVQFQNQTQGAIACNIGALNTIYTAIAGWNTITNTTAGTLGNLVESRAAFEARRSASVAGNSVNSLSSIYASVASVPNVIDVFVVDNPSNSSVNYGSTSYSLAPHSICVSVAGGTSSAIAQAIWNKKPPGTGYNGNTSATVYDTNYPSPQPSYTVTWLTPTSTAVYFAVSLKNNAQLPSNITQLVQNAIIESFSGEDGGTAAGIAQTITSGRYYANVNAISPSVEILSILIGFTNLAGATNTQLTFGIDQLPTISASQIGVTLV